ncbi:MAG: hypothetical protein HC834_05670 [Rhodospirillales bacterium]|nr:hypothetical protein [Rhodospirillales bacterium]
MILYAGEPRYLLYGTDWPICTMHSYLKFMRGLGLPEEKLELYRSAWDRDGAFGAGLHVAAAVSRAAVRPTHRRSDAWSPTGIVTYMS